MKIRCRNYSPEPFHTDDYVKVREFLARINTKEIHTPRFPWGAWEWAVTHMNRDQKNLGKIGLWEDDGILVALAAYEINLGESLFAIDENYSHLKHEMIVYAKNNLYDNNKIKILLPDNDYEFARAAVAEGFRPTQNYERNAVLDIDKLQSYSLPDGFSFHSMSDGWNWEQYNRVMRRGFGNVEDPVFNGEILKERKLMLSSPMIIPELVIAVLAPDGSYAAHCGIWYRPGEFYCYIEPVVTDPGYQKMGLGKAVVLEAVRRAGVLGAKLAVVSSGQQFYYNIGFYPIQTMTHWEML